MRPISFLDVNIGDLRFFYHRNSPRQDQHVPVHGYHYRTVEETLFVNHILHITCKIFSKSMNVYQLHYLYMNIHFLTVKEYNRTINIFIFHCASDWSNNFEG